MSRYLTPSKVCLLVLIEAYSEGHVETPVPVLSFLIKSISPNKNTAPAPLPLELFNQTLSAIKSIKPGRKIWDVFLEKIWFLECADSLHAFFDDLERLIEKPQPAEGEERDDNEAQDQYQGVKFTRSSPMGAFVRRAQVEFTRLNFADSTQLWKNFVIYRLPSFNAWAKRAGPAAANNRSFVDTNLELLPPAETIRDIVYGDLPSIESQEARYSTEDVERLLDYCVSAMTKTGSRIPGDIRARMVELATGNSITIPSASHYVRYLDSWKAGDYPAALDNLHRYFDYTIQTRDGRSHYQYALLNMALLHAHFGAHAEAISAMQETVATARENKDVSCLNYTLSWLYHFGQAHPAETREVQRSGVLGRGKEALAFLQAKAREGGSWGLLSSSLVADARLAMQQGDGLAAAMENLVSASHLNLTKRLPAAVGAAMATEAALWARLAIVPLANAKDDILLECYAATGAADADVVQAVCRRASSLADRGQYSQALFTMNNVSPETLRSLTNNATWSVRLGMIKMQHALRRQDFAASEHYLAQLRAMAGMGGASSANRRSAAKAGSVAGSGSMSSSTGADPDTCFNIAFLHIRMLLAQGELTSAFSLIYKTSRELDVSRTDVYHRTQLMLLKGQLWARAGQPARGFSVVLRACSVAQSARLLPLLWDGIAALSNMLISMGELTAAQELLKAVIPHILATEDCESIATAYTTLAEVHVGLAGRANNDSSATTESETQDSISSDDNDDDNNTDADTVGSSPDEDTASATEAGEESGSQQPGLKKKEEIVKAIEYLSRAFDAWSAIDDVAGQTETLAKQAVLTMMQRQQTTTQQQMPTAADSQLANDCAAKYRDIRDKARNDGTEAC